MGGTALARERRLASRLFTERVFVGRAIDIGAGPDPITTAGFPLLREVVEWDLERGHDAMAIDFAPGHFDLVYSSHCLEHIERRVDAVIKWWKLVKIGGHLVIVVPDEELYERGVWPPHFNSDHKDAYTTVTKDSPSTIFRSVRVQELVDLCMGGRLISLVRLEDGFDPTTEADQTANCTCECGIELVVRREHA